jgi:hypothetical protein
MLTLDVPDFPELVAVIVAVPAATPVTTPVEFTVAIPLLLVDQLRGWPVIVLPWASFTVAESATVAPTAIDALGGETVTFATTGACAVTVNAAVPLFPELVAVMVAVPAATPVTIPLAFTVATLALLVAHVTI